MIPVNTRACAVSASRSLEDSAVCRSGKGLSTSASWAPGQALGHALGHALGIPRTSGRPASEDSTTRAALAAVELPGQELRPRLLQAVRASGLAVGDHLGAARVGRGHAMARAVSWWCEELRASPAQLPCEVSWRDETSRRRVGRLWREERRQLRDREAVTEPLPCRHRSRSRATVRRNTKEQETMRLEERELYRHGIDGRRGAAIQLRPRGGRS
jgi:hypothetical protein